MDKRGVVFLGKASAPESLVRALAALGYETVGRSESSEELFNVCRDVPVALAVAFPGSDQISLKLLEKIEDRLKLPVILFDDTGRLPEGYSAVSVLKTDFRPEQVAYAVEAAVYKHKLKQQLSRSRTWLSSILKSIGDAVLAIDLKGSIQFINLAAENLLKLKSQNCVGRHIDEIADIQFEKNGKRLKNPVYEAMLHRNTVRAPFDIMLVRPDGSKTAIGCKAAPIIIEGGDILGAVMVFWDVTEQKKAREALHAAHEQLEQRVEERTRELASANRELQEQILVRQKAEADLERAYSELQAAHLKLIQSEKMAALGRFSSGIAHEIKNPLGIILSGIEYLQIRNLVQADFSAKEFSSSTPDVLLAAASAAGYLEAPAQGQDALSCLNGLLSRPDFYNSWSSRHAGVSLRREVMELLSLTAPLRQSQLKDMMPAELAVIKFLNRLLLEISFPDVCPKSREYMVFSTMQKIKDATIRADTIVKNLLKFSRPAEMKTEKLRPEEIIDYAIYNIPMEEKNHVEIVTSYGHGLFINVDYNQLVQVMINLLVNAAQAIPKPRRGKIEVRTYETVMPEMFGRTRLCAIEVKDNGSGIKKEDMPRLFEPFFTTKIYNKTMGKKPGPGAKTDTERASVQGTGLGLSVSKSIVNTHKGEIFVSSKEGEGTVFRIILPFAT